MALRPRITLAQHRGHRPNTAPAVEPITLAYMQDILSAPPTEDADFIESCITQARVMFEAATRIACITQKWELTLDDWPNLQEDWWDGVREMATTELYGRNTGPRHIEIPRYPLQAVDELSVFSWDDTETAVTVAEVFYTDLASFPGRLIVRDGQSWPVALRTYNGIKLIYTAGFGDTAADVPETVRRAIGNATAFLYENRGTGCTSGAVLAGSGALALAADYINVRL